MSDKKYEVVKSMEFDGDILITDPCYVTKGDDWEKSGYGNLRKLGIKHSITNNTLYGDWSCSVFKASDHDSCTDAAKIGEFCADTGLVSVMLYDEAKAYNPEVKDFVKSHDWCAAVIEDFHGIVEMRQYEDYYEDDEAGRMRMDYLELYGISDGRVDWMAFQTGL